MDKVSSIMIGGVTIGATTLTPYVQWAMDGFPRPVPNGTAPLLASLLVAGLHALYSYGKSRAATKQSAPPSA
jgi:hypothetical protein